MNRAALYLRVSREDLAIENQRYELKSMARLRGLEVVEAYEEHVSGAAVKRPEHARMLADAHRGHFDVLLIWAIDRFGRSMFHNLRDIMALDEAGIAVVSAKEAWMDTRGPTRQLLIGIFSWVAEQERERLIERTKAGQARARAQGKHIGRKPRVTPELAVEIARRVAEDWSIREIAVALKIPKATVYRTVRALPRGATNRNPRAPAPSASDGHQLLKTDAASALAADQRRAAAPSASDTAMVTNADAPAASDKPTPGSVPEAGPKCDAAST